MLTDKSGQTQEPPVDGASVVRSGLPALIAPPLPRAAALAVAALFSLGITFNGLNSSLGNPLTCMIGAGALLLLTLAWPPHAGFFGARAAPLALIAAGSAWALLPSLVPALSGTNLRPDLGLSEALGIAGFLCALLCGSRIGERRENIITAVDALVAVGCANALASLAWRSWGGEAPFDLWQIRPDARFTGTVSNANVAGTYFGMMAALAFARLVGIPSHAWRGDPGKLAQAGAYLVALTLLLEACFLTGSRSAGAASLMVLVAISVLRFRKERRRGSNRVVLAAAAVVVLLIATVGIADLLVDRLSEAVGGDNSGRPLMWAHYVQLFQQAPWFGYGLGSFETLNARYLGDPRLAQELWTVNSPHNLILQFLLDGGIVYLALVGAAAWLIGRGILARAAAFDWQYASDGIVGALAIVVACAMVDIVLDVPAMACLTAFIAGLLWIPRAGASPNRRRGPRTSAGERTDRPRFAG